MLTLQLVKQKVKENYPWIITLRSKLSMAKAYLSYCGLIIIYRVRYPFTSVFKIIHNKKTWGTDSSSGGGSDTVQTTVIRQELPRIISELNIRSMIDAPCGDYHWMLQVPLGGINYLGMDIVPDLIESNNKKYAKTDVQFQCADITKDDLPQVELILCRDCLVHLSIPGIKQAIQTFKRSGSKYLLTTTYPGVTKKNWNIVSGMWRPIDLQKPPFNLPKPLQLINEQCTEGTDYKEKSLGLWRISDIPDQ